MSDVASEAAVEAVLETPTLATEPKQKPAEEDVIEAMKDVVDPELGINVVDLGLVYGAQVHDVDAELGVDDVLHRLEHVLLRRLGLRLGRQGRRLEDRLRLRGAGLGHAAPPRACVSSTARAVASFHAIQPSRAHLTRAG